MSTSHIESCIKMLKRNRTYIGDGFISAFNSELKRRDSLSIEGGWKNDSLFSLQRKVREKAEKLCKEVHLYTNHFSHQMPEQVNKIIKEAVDVGNFASMIVDNGELMKSYYKAADEYAKDGYSDNKGIDSEE